MWKSTVEGRALHFYLAGINNQNFLMRDQETGSWWQQISGRAIYGPLKGAALEFAPSDELTFAEWKTEVPDGEVLMPVAKDTKKYESNWEPDVAKLPVVISFPGTELKSRDIVLGVEIEGASRAYPWESVVKQSPVSDRVNGTPILIVVAPDKKSFRAFISRVDGQDTEFFLKVDASGAKNWALVDTATASEWNFQGCATAGASSAKCLDRIAVIKDYWFDWRNYHAATTIYKR